MLIGNGSIKGKMQFIFFFFIFSNFRMESGILLQKTEMLFL